MVGHTCVSEIIDILVVSVISTISVGPDGYFFFLVCEEEEVTCMFAMNAFRKHAALHSAGVKLGNVVQKNFGFLRKLSSLTPCDVVALTCFCFCLSPFFPFSSVESHPRVKNRLLFGRRYFRAVSFLVV